MDRYIDVAVDLPVFETYTYQIPDNLYAWTEIGRRVLVPFGRQRTTGYILDFCKSPPDDIKLKSIIDVLDEYPLFPGSLLPFFQWIANYYLYPIGKVIQTALPSGINLKDSLVAEINPDGLKNLVSKALSGLESNIIACLQDRKQIPVKYLEKQIDRKLPASLLNQMAQKRYIKLHRVLQGGGTGFRMEKYVRIEKRLSKPDPTVGPTQRKILKRIEAHGDISLRELKIDFPSAPRLVPKLYKNGWIQVYEKRVYRDPFGEPVLPDTAPRLTPEQEVVFEKMNSLLKEGFNASLLAGVTGSGKTEVYMQLADKVVQGGKSVIVLVPEIALISQTERRFRARFGEQVAVLHSRLTKGERFDQWMRIANGDVPIAIGARSAIFSPFNRLGLIVVDEEHDSAYKQETGLRYNARDLAVIRAKIQKCSVILGSATPSIQSCHNVKIGKFKELNIKYRVENRFLPEISLIDLRYCRKVRRGGGIISYKLYEAIADAVNRHEQVLLFLNRRGFSNISICKSCGEVLRCKHCDISLTFHKSSQSYRCHLCGYSKASISNCASCDSKELQHMGIGTEKVEMIIKQLFPEARTARMDRDTVGKKGSLLTLLKGLRQKSIDIIIGTQMVAKGHDFPGITLVGILCADLSLGFPDFRAAESTCQLLAQVAGRSGRGDVRGKVLLQTYNPNHYSITSAKHQDFRMFYNLEIDYRQALEYPPFARMIRLLLSGKNAEKTEKTAQNIGAFLSDLQQSFQETYEKVEILGPNEAPLARIANRYRWQILLKSHSIKSLRQMAHTLFASDPNLFRNKEVQIVLDVDPVFML
jgi:primosomal protein N' (replication factor Y)